MSRIVSRRMMSLLLLEAAMIRTGQACCLFICLRGSLLAAHYLIILVGQKFSLPVGFEYRRKPPKNVVVKVRCESSGQWTFMRICKFDRNDVSTSV